MGLLNRGADQIRFLYRNIFRYKPRPWDLLLLQFFFKKNVFGWLIHITLRVEKTQEKLQVRTYFYRLACTLFSCNRV